MQLRDSIRHHFVAARRVAVAVLATVAVAGCSATESLLEVSDPDIINPGDVQTSQAANALRLGALARLNTATTGGGASGNGGESSFLLGGMLADEYRSSDTFGQRNETDRRAVQVTNGNVSDAFRTLHRARLSADQAIAALRKFEAPAWQIAQMYLVQAFVENQMAQDFCGHLPFSTVIDGKENLGNPLTTQATLERALAHADSGLRELPATSADTATQTLIHALSVLKGRILVNLDRPADAATAVASVPVGFRYFLEHSANTNTNAIWSLGNSNGRWYVSQGEGTNGLNFATAADPRLVVCRLVGTAKQGCGTDTPVSAPFDNTTPVVDGVRLHIQQKWPGRYDRVAILTGVEAGLIRAEAQLDAGQSGTALATLNDLRANGGVAGLAALTDAGTPAARVDQLFRERAFWLFGTGQRLGDMRRLIRQYGRTQDQVFPVGAYWKGGNYGTDVTLPVPQAEENNTNFVRASCVTSAA